VIDGLAEHATGSGEDVLWFHGYTMDSSVFAEVWAALGGFRHIGIDLPGHGASRPFRTPEELDALAATIADAAELRGIRHLAGLSFGTLLALQVAIARPNAFTSLVLAAPGLAGGRHEPEIEQRFMELALLHRTAGPGAHMTALWMRDPPDTFKYVNRRPILACRLGAVIDGHAWSELETFATLGFTRPAQNREALAGIRAATLVLIGEHELEAHRACAELIVDAVPDAALETIPEAGHLALLEDPVVAADAIAAHLTRRPSARAR
jgi:3-oxoadipate enol-lactonase